MVLSVTVLPPVFGPVMMSVSKSEPSRSVDGHDLLAVDERMARPHEFQTGVRADLRLHAVHLVRQARAGKDAVELHEHLIAVADALAERAPPRPTAAARMRSISFFSRISSSRRALFAFTADIGSMKNVLPVDGHIVDQTGNFTLVLALDRHNIAVAAHA